MRLQGQDWSVRNDTSHSPDWPIVGRPIQPLKSRWPRHPETYDRHEGRVTQSEKFPFSNCHLSGRESGVNGVSLMSFQIHECRWHQPAQTIADENRVCISQVVQSQARRQRFAPLKQRLSQDAGQQASGEGGRE